MFLRTFFLAVALLVAGLMAIYRVDLSDPFAETAADGKCRTLDMFTPQDIAEIKYEHAEALERFDLGLFGSSRVLMVGSSDIDSRSSRFFNFAVGGMSLRQSVALLESLAAVKRAPRLVLIGFDNMTAQFYGNAEWPPMPERLVHVYRDLIEPEARQTLGLNARIRMAWRHMWTFWQTAKQSLGTSRLRARMFEVNPNNETDCYRSDGSRKRRENFAPTKITLTPPAKQSVPPGYLDNDMARLAAIGDSKIIVFETPLAPGLVSSDPISAATRAAWFTACAAHGLTCVSAPVTVQSESGPYWSDVSHSPAAALGRYLAGLSDGIVPTQ
jgi:hypothetical protein